jgi:YHS domain-containing protein
MKTFLHSAFLGLTLAVAAMAFGGDKAPSTQPTPQPVNQFCPMNPEDKADPNVTYNWNGKTVAFCCSHCIDEFKKDPEKHGQNMK